MIKVIVHVTKAIVAIVASLLLLSCGTGIEGSGNVVTQKRPVEADFKSVSAGRGLEVLIEQKGTRSITVEADDNLQQHIKTEIVDGELKIYSDVNIGKAEAKRVIVSLPTIESIESESGASVRSKNTLKGDSMELGSSSGSNLEVTVEAKNLSCEASSGSQLTVNGQAENLETDSSSGSRVNAKGLSAKNVRSNASSGGSALVNPSQNLSAEASSGGNINYVNTPGNLSKNTSSGGSVSQE